MSISISKILITLSCGAALLACPAFATTVDVYDGLGFDFTPLNTFFTGQGYTVNQLSAGFSSFSGANFVILSDSTGLTTSELSLIDSYVSGGGHLLLNSEGANFPSQIAEANAILSSLGSSIVNQTTSFDSGYNDTTNIVSTPFTAGVDDVNYGYTSSLTGGSPLAYGVSGQDFISYQAIGSGYVFVIADSDTADNINSTTTNNNGVLYCDIGALSCAATSAPATPEPSSLLLLGTGLTAAATVLRRRIRG